MASAARSARSAFGDIRSAAMDSAEGVARGTTNMRAAIGLVDNTIRGNHAAAMADLIREFKDSSFVMAALPFAAVVGGIAAIAGIAIEVALKIKEWREEQQKLNDEQMKFGTAVQESFNSLDDKFLQAEKRADELRNDHLGALNKELQLINHASLADLAKEFETISKAADATFKGLESHWYTLGIGSAGAKHALDEFKTQYDALLSQGKDKEASDLLAGTRASAERVLEAQNAMQNSVKDRGMMGASVDYETQYKARAVLQQAGIGNTKDEIKSVEALVQVLNEQATAEGKIARNRNADGDNAKTQYAHEASSQRSEAARQTVASQVAMGEMVVAADRATAQARLQIQHSSIQERLDSEIEFSNREMAIQLAGNQAQIAALDKFSKDYPNNLSSYKIRPWKYSNKIPPRSQR
jgi:hypothetical protein